MSEITYIIGAGTSFQSIPLVSTFNNRLLDFADFISQRGYKIFNGEERNKFVQASEAIKGLYSEFSSHQSFDTWFKKQFHMGNDVAINQGKRMLHLYFIWEHSKASYDFVRNETPKGEIFIKESLYDKRYDALIAGLLKPYRNVAETMLKINFITWNYDLNLIQSVKNFFAPKKTFKDFIQEIEKLPFYWDIRNQISIINVNGVFYSSKYDEVNSLNNINSDAIIDSKILDDYWMKPNKDSDADKIRFAWEMDESEAKQLVFHINNNMQKSNRIVIIGYTFPVYNRIIDSSYLTDRLLSNSDKKVTIQDPKAESIRSTLIELLGQPKALESIVDVKNDCSSFYVPSDIYI
jgi:hypothetical protein